MTRWAQVPNRLARDGSVPAPAKLVYVLLAGHADTRAQCWPKRKVLAEEAGISERAVQRALLVLRDHGWIDWKRTGRGSRYTLLQDTRCDTGGTSEEEPMGHPCHIRSDTGGTSDVTPASGLRKKNQELEPRTRELPPVAAAPAGDVEVDLFGAEVVPITPTRNAGTLVAAWHDGWASTHPERPDPTLAKRAKGSAANVAKDRTDDRSWRVAIEAARCAGAQGRYDIVGALVPPGPRQGPALDVVPANLRWS